MIEQLSIDQLEEQVVFSEWRALRSVSSRSLTRTRALARLLGHDPEHPPFSVVGIVGSKGKGTTAAHASAALAGAGMVTGTIMSPGIISNADRVRVNGRILDEVSRRRALLRIERAQRHLPPATAESGYLAPTGLFLLWGMLLCEEAGCAVVVAEAGMGGRSDDLSHWQLDGVAISSIFAEHLDVLGPTVADVAADKAAVVTDSTGWCLSLPQTPEVSDIIASRCADTHTVLTVDPALPAEWVAHLPEGFSRHNAALGVVAGLRWLAEHHTAAWDAPGMQQAVRSVHYPGRLSVHPVPALGAQADPHPDSPSSTGPAAQPWCLVDSAVSGAGLSAALALAARLPRTANPTAFTASPRPSPEETEGPPQADGVGYGADQVLVCLPPSKDLNSFIEVLRAVPQRKVFVEMPQAYTGMPHRSQWPWEWADQSELPVLLAQGHSAAVGTVLFTAEVLRLLGAHTQRLFTLPDPLSGLSETL